MKIFFEAKIKNGILRIKVQSEFLENFYKVVTKRGYMHFVKTGIKSDDYYKRTYRPNLQIPRVIYRSRLRQITIDSYTSLLSTQIISHSRFNGEPTYLNPNIFALEGLAKGVTIKASYPLTDDTLLEISKHYKAYAKKMLKAYAKFLKEIS